LNTKGIGSVIWRDSKKRVFQDIISVGCSPKGQGEDGMKIER
jgi:hypothetical protein